MDLTLLVIFGSLIQFGNAVETQDMDAVLRRLDEMDAKFVKVDALFTGFEQLCQSINRLKATHVSKNSETLKECGDEDKLSDNCLRKGETVANGNEKNIADNEGDVASGYENEAEGSYDRLEITSVHYGGLVGGKVNVSVVYIADDSCVSEWFITGVNSSETRTIGEVTRYKYGDGRVGYHSRIELPESSALGYVLFMINSQSYSAYLDFNISMLETQGDDSILPLQYDILDFPRRIEIPETTLKTEGLHTSITVSDNIVERLNRDNLPFQLSIDYINSTASAPVLTNVWQHSSRYNFSISVSDEIDNQLDIFVASELAHFGGTLMVRLHQNVDSYKFVRGFTWGVKIQFVNEAVGGLMPYDTFGLYNDKTIVPIRGKSFAVLCMAFGVPVPQVSMQRKGEKGPLVELEPDYVVVQEPFTYQVVNFQVKSPNTVEMITCRATDGNKTRVQFTTYMAVTRAKIDEKKTRLVKNTTDKVVVTCKATGNPVPDIELRTIDGNMTNLMEDDRFEHKVTKKKFASKVTLTMAPPDETIRSVLCFAQQTIEGRSKGDTALIEIFPPMFDAEPTYYNYTIDGAPYFGDYN